MVKGLGERRAALRRGSLYLRALTLSPQGRRKPELLHQLCYRETVTANLFNSCLQIDKGTNKKGHFV
jgi:hypothetical protein